MHHHLTKVALVLLILFIAACSNKPSQPDTPEQVAKKWQDHIDKNRFDEARQLSTANAKEIVDMIEMIFTDEGGNEEWVSETLFTQMNCTEKGDTAVCICLIREEDELIEDSFLLVRVDGKWLVDIEEEDLEPLPSLDRIFDELKDVMDDTTEVDSLIIQ